MIRKLAFCAAAFVCMTQATANAADCKFEENRVDKFTKVKIVQTKWERLSSLPGFFAASSAHASVRVKDDETYLGIKLMMKEGDEFRPRPYQLRNRISIAQGASLLLMMADGSIVELQTPAGASLDATIQVTTDTDNKPYYSIESAGNLEYTLDEESIAALSKQDVTYMRIAGVEKYTDVYSEHIDFEIREKMFGSIRSALQCAELI